MGSLITLLKRISNHLRMSEAGELVPH